MVSAMASHITSLTIVYPGVIQAQIKALRHWTFWWEFTGDRGIPRTMACNAENISIWWRHHDSIYHSPLKLFPVCSIVLQLVVLYEPGSIITTWRCRKTFKPMGTQISLKAVLPLPERITIASDVVVLIHTVYPKKYAHGFVVLC